VKPGQVPARRSKAWEGLSVDPLADKYLGLSPYNYCSNNPLNITDIDGNIQRDQFGQIITTFGGYFHFGYNMPDGSTKEFQASMYYIYADNGEPIKAYVNNPDEPGLKMDCHGYTFADGRYWINSTDLPKVDDFMKWANYSKVDGTPQVGDVAVWVGVDKVMRHSAKVVEIKENGTIMVEGNSGTQSDIKKSDAKDTYPYQNTKVEYYHKNKPDKIVYDKLHDLGPLFNPKVLINGVEVPKGF
jgi:hypothetical protein